MKIVKIFGVVVGIHVFALVLIFANPGCTTRTPSRPSPSETVASPAPTSAATVSLPAASADTVAPSPVTSASVTFNPETPAASTGVHYSPTRPGTAEAGALQAEPVADVVPASKYTVKSGDNLWTIAKKNHLTATELATANGLKASSVVQPGQKLIIPSKPVSAADRKGDAPKTASAVPAAAPAKVAADATKHIVAPGESLSVIAAKYGVKSGDLAVANNISDPRKLRAGMELVIPGWQSKAPKTAAKTAGSAEGVSTTIRLPAADQDLDTGLRPAQPAAVPVIGSEPSPISPAPTKKP